MPARLGLSLRGLASGVKPLSRHDRVWIDGAGPGRRDAWLAWEAAMPLFILFGGELFLTFAALRVAIWVLRGWRDFDAGPPSGPPGPQGGLPLAHPQRRRLRRGGARAA